MSGNAPIASRYGQNCHQAAWPTIEGVAGDDEGGAATALLVTDRVAEVQEPEVAAHWPRSGGAHQSSPMEACMSAKLASSHSFISASYSAAASGSAYKRSKEA